MPDGSRSARTRIIRKIHGLGTRERNNNHKRTRVPISLRDRQPDDPTPDQNSPTPIKKIYGLGTRERKTPPKLFEGLRRPAKPRSAKKRKHNTS